MGEQRRQRPHTDSLVVTVIWQIAVKGFTMAKWKSEQSASQGGI